MEGPLRPPVCKCLLLYKGDVRLYPKRKSPRLPGFDYSTYGYYFVTICTYDRKCLLGRIVGEGL